MAAFGASSVLSVIDSDVPSPFSLPRPVIGQGVTGSSKMTEIDGFASVGDLRLS
jgi:hypothetical protein